jgi:CRISPR system Cascade subunit CasD
LDDGRMSARTLVLRFAGSAQSWASAPYAIKATEGVPTRSAVLGMLAAALGVPRGPLPGWLHATEIHVRVDRPGTVVTDFHTISNPPADVGAARTRQRLAASAGRDKNTAHHTVPVGDGGPWSKSSMVTERAYLADAEFIVTVSHPDDGKLDSIAAAVVDPVFMPYLGRKAFAPAFPFNLGVHDQAAHVLLDTLPTSSTTGRQLAVHAITQDKNYATGFVPPHRAPSRSDLWKGWKAA